MSKFKLSILILSIIVIVLAASLLTVLLLYSTGAIVTDRIELVYKIEDASKVYDGAPLLATDYSLLSGELRKGHTAVVKPLGELTDVGESESDLSVTVTDKDGFDVSANYSVKVIKGTLAVYPADIEVKLNDAEVVYNGSKIVFDDYHVTKGSLVSGHKIAGSSDAVLLNVGDRLTDEIRPLVFDARGRDVTANYNIVFQIGTITVAPCPIVFKPISISKVYDGESLVADGFEIIGGALADGQWATVEINYGNNTQTSAGFVETEITRVTVYARNGLDRVDVTHNYEIDLSETGTMEVFKRDAIILTPSLTKVYDGESFDANQNTPDASNLVYGHSVTSNAVLSSLTDVGTLSNEYSCAIIDEYGKEVTDNYNITYSYGTLTVTPKAVSFSLEDIASEYNGNIQIPSIDVALQNIDVEGLTNDDFEIVTYLEIKNVGVYSYTARLKEATSAKNYNIIVNSAYITITPIQAELVYTGSEKINKIYDGKPVEINLSKLGLTSNEGESLTRYYVSSADYQKECLVGSDINLAVNSVKIADRSSGLDVTENFVVNCGKVVVSASISKRPIILALDNYYSPYPFIDEDVAVSLVRVVSGLLPDDYLDIERIIVGWEMDLILESIGICNSSGEDVTDCYDWVNEGYVSSSIIVTTN